MHIIEVDFLDLDSLRNISIDTFMIAFGAVNEKENMDAYISQAFSASQLAKEIREPETTFYFAMEKETVVGYLKLNTGQAQTDLQEANSLEIERIYVLPDVQGRGIGGQMLDFAIEKALIMEKEFIWLGVWEHNHGAIRFYSSYGFSQFDQHPFMLGKDRQIDLLFRKKL
ncbi:MAG: GNAT family N-acetyltransferase [Saprospiraceae bacterium]|nr:GNAT family N-acetyltransferase [Saprospiraceae bacterium]